MNSIKSTKKIAIVKHGGLGDQIMCSALVKAIRKHHPDSHITMFAGSSTSEFWKNNILINRIMPIPSIYEMQTKNGLELSMIDSCLNGIIDEKFDVLINPSHDTDVYLTGLFVQKIKSEVKVSFYQKNNVYSGYDSNDYYDRHIDRPHFENVALYQNYLFKKIFNEDMGDVYGTNCFTSNFEKECVDLSLGPELEDIPLVGIHANGSSVYRIMSESQLIKISAIVEKMGAFPLILGSGDVSVDGKKLNYTGRLPILVLAELVKRLSAVICVDSAVKHLAGIYKVPTIEFSHIPKSMMYLNGPYIDGQYKYSAIEYWAPKNDGYFHEVVYPLDEFLEADIASGRTLQSIDFSNSCEILSKILKK